MIIPSIDLINGHAVQLVGGKVEQLKVDAGDPVPIAKQFRVAGEIAIVDLDAALSKGNNNLTIENIMKECAVSNCIVRVGGGIRDVQSALNWLNKGAHKVVLGTAATPEILSQLPKNRVIAAVDALNGEVVVKGWTTKTGANVFDKVKELKPFVAGFLVTFVEREGKMQGIDMNSVKQLKEVVGDDCELTIAGGVTTLEEIADLDRLGVKAQVGMALYTGHMNLADGIIAPLTSDRPDGLFPTVVVDEQGVNLGLVYSNKESIRESVKLLKGVYHSRKRGLWVKGETSGATQDLLGIRLDCDRDALCFIVHQNGKGFCHFNNRTCWEEGDFGIPALVRTLEHRKANPIEGSYTNKLLNNPSLLHSKILEEARELTEAKSKSEVIWEAADVIYFALVACVQNGVSFNDLQEELNKRALKVTRRGGDAKPPKSDVNSNVSQTKVSNETTSTSNIPVSEEFTSMKRLSVEEATKFTAQVQPVDLHVLSAAKKIVDDVREGGEKAVKQYGVKLGDIKQDENLIMTVSQLKEAFLSLKVEEQELLKRISARIKKFAESQKHCLTDLFTRIEGGNAGHKVIPLESAGCYAPGGRYPLPSSVLMTVITARVAGVKNVWVASPKPTVVTAAAAFIAGADGLLKVGGAHGIAALAYGMHPFIPPADAVVGPGNKWVTAAKQLISGRVKIDMLAGPSECLVIADQSANASVIAADLLAQAEHDIDARPLLICVGDNNHSIANAVDKELHNQLKTLPTADTAKVSLARNGVVVLVNSIEEAVQVSDSLASEHLEIHLNDLNLSSLRKKIKNYGGLFVGEHSAEVFGDYGAGPNHVLPTGGTSRYTGGLSVFTFLKIQTFLETSPQESSVSEFNTIVKDTVQLALLEGLHGHANAASIRHIKEENREKQIVAINTDKEMKKYLRTDIEKIDKYKPVKPLEILADEIGIPANKLIKIDANENLYGPVSSVFDAISNANLHIYPDPSQSYLRKEIAKLVNTNEERIVAGAGSDDILDILIRLVNPISVITSSPTFGMYSFLGKINGSSFIDVPRDTNFNVIPENIIEAAKKHLRPIVFLASPNNPTGNLLENSTIEYLCTELAKFNCLVVIDEAYAEFARDTCLSLMNRYFNLVIVRTFSKWAGLAGLRVGYSISDPTLASYMMAIKQPYNINVAADVAARATLANLEQAMKRVNAIKEEREKLKEEISSQFGKWLQVYPSEANFLLIKVSQIPAYLLSSFLRKKGILVRYFNTPVLQSFIRISAGTPKETESLIHLLKELTNSPNMKETILREYNPQAILWDMDGVLANVSNSYRQAIIKTCEHFGVSISSEDIAKAKAAGNANNDWILSLSLITSKWNKQTPIPSLKEVTDVFEDLYQGTDQIEGLWRTEQLIPSIELLEYAYNKYPMAIVTGRPRKDAIKFLTHFNIQKYFKFLVCMEDAPAKPDPTGVKMALTALHVSKAMMIGDTPDDIRAATGADIVGIGIISPSESSKSSSSSLIEDSMYNSGALFVINSFQQFEKLII